MTSFAGVGACEIECEGRACKRQAKLACRCGVTLMDARGTGDSGSWADAPALSRDCDVRSQLRDEGSMELELAEAANAKSVGRHLMQWDSALRLVALAASRL